MRDVAILIYFKACFASLAMTRRTCHCEERCLRRSNLYLLFLPFVRKDKHVGFRHRVQTGIYPVIARSAMRDAAILIKDCFGPEDGPRNDTNRRLAKTGLGLISRLQFFTILRRVHIHKRGGLVGKIHHRRRMALQPGLCLASAS